ncbi:MAG: hypothetical protein ACYCV6_02705 [Steroidobacteraceae bacterium]
MAESSEQDERESASPPLDTRIVKIGKLRFAVGTMWLSWATTAANPAEARAWLADQQDVLPSFEALFIAPGAENRTDIGLSGVFQPKLRALAQVVAAHAETFAPQLPSEAYRWGVSAETVEGIYLCAASRDGLPLADALVDAEGVEAAKAQIDGRHADIHWMATLPIEDFEQKLLAHAPAEPIALPRASKTKIRVVMAAALALVIASGVVFVQHYRAEKAREAALAAAAAVKVPPRLPSGYQVGGALDACLAAFQHTSASSPGWHLVAAACDVHNASFIWHRGHDGLAIAAPAGARVTSNLRSAMLTVPLHIGRCEVDAKARYARIEAAISDWAIAQHERWRAGGGMHPLISIEGIIPAWEMPVSACVQSIGVRWTRSGLWRLNLGW